MHAEPFATVTHTGPPAATPRGAGQSMTKFLLIVHVPRGVIAIGRWQWRPACSPRAGGRTPHGTADGPEYGCCAPDCRVTRGGGNAVLVGLAIRFFGFAPPRSLGVLGAG